ncbi:MAG: hypothetical protein ACK4K9_09880 [Bacteroidia bacterium]
MQKKLNYLLGLLVSVGIFILMYLLYIPNFILQPNRYVFNLIGDGIKNYYSLLYYLRYDKGLHFTGMAYPFGDSYVLTDGQPLLAGFILLIKPFYPFIIYDVVAIVNLVVLISPILCVVAIQKILVQYKVNKFYSWAFAIGITLLSPQIERFPGHQSLSYTFFIPVVWLILIKIHAKLKFLNGITYLLFVLGMAFLHPYYLAIGLVFYFIYLLVQILNGTYSLKNNFLKILLLMVIGLLPLIIFQIFSSINISNEGRVEIPWGFTFQRAAFASIFFNGASPFYFLQPRFLEIGKYVFEGKVYLGYFALPIFVWFLIKSVITKFKNFYKMPKTGIYAFLFTGIGAYIYSTAFPFYMPPFDNLLDYIPYITQFRAVGRFAWILYYCFNIFLVVYICTLTSLKGNLKHLVIIIMLSVLLIEGFAHTKGVLKRIASNPNNNIFIYEEPNLGYENPQDYQAILPIKLFALGSEQAGLTHTDPSIQNAFWLSFKTGLPIVSFSMSRTKVSQANQIIQLASNKAIYKTIADSFYYEKPLLVVVSDSLNLTNGEIELINRSSLILKDKNYSLYKLYPNKINESAKHIAPNYNENVNSKKCIYVPLFENSVQTAKKYYGEITLFNQKANKLMLNDSIEFSVLTKKTLKQYGIVELHLTEKDENGNIVNYYSSQNKENYNVCGEYIRLHYTFKPKNLNNILDIKLKAKDFNFYSLLFKKPDDVFYHTNPLTGERFLNNFLLYQ